MVHGAVEVDECEGAVHSSMSFVVGSIEMADRAEVSVVFLGTEIPYVKSLAFFHTT